MQYFKIYNNILLYLQCANSAYYFRALPTIKVCLYLIFCLLFCSCESLAYFWLKPGGAFATHDVPSVLDYSLEDSWAALPDKDDMADFTAFDEVDLQTRAKVDVFFIHPTTHLSGGWNQSLSNDKVNKRTNKGPIRQQSSIFNSVGKIYAPHYRQAVLFSFMAEDEDEQSAEAALNLAYKDISLAFEYYLKNYNNGRPIILATHSQGSLHGLRLLRDYFSQKKLRKQLVAAYIIGMYFPEKLIKETIPDIPLAQKKDDTGCLITWNSVNTYDEVIYLPPYRFLTLSKEKYDINKDRLACINPLNWSEQQYKADETNHKGIVIFKDNQPKPKPDKQIICTKCDERGFLNVEVSAWKYWWLSFLSGNYHILDLNLFYIDIRRNAEERVAAYLKNNYTPESTR